MQASSIALLSIILLVYSNNKCEAELKLLNVVFMHGDRALSNDGFEDYPNNLYRNNLDYPIGYGELNNNGKRREFYLGQYLRYKYGYFLGNVYFSKDIYARSTDDHRTKMSLQLVLAGLYPPNNFQRWNIYLNWQPIPTTYVNKLDDTLMYSSTCPNYLKAREQVQALPPVVEKTNNFKQLMDYLTKETGKNISSFNDIKYLYTGLMSTVSMNLNLPGWTRGIFPYGKLHEGAVFEYELASYNDELKRLNGGMLLRKITDDMSAACSGRFQRKISLYSGHEFNIVALLQTLGVYRPYIPRYSSAVIIELHEVYNVCKVKINYYKGCTVNSESIDQELYVPGCYGVCTLDRFKESRKNVIATNDDIKCDKRSLRNDLENGKMNLSIGITKPLLDEIYKEDKWRNVLY